MNTETLDLIRELCNQLGIAVSAGIEAASRYISISSICSLIGTAITFAIILGTICVVCRKVYKIETSKDKGYWDDISWQSIIILFIGLIVCVGSVICFGFSFPGLLGKALEPTGALIMGVLS